MNEPRANPRPPEPSEPTVPVRIAFGAKTMGHAYLRLRGGRVVADIELSPAGERVLFPGGQPTLQTLAIELK